MIKERKQENDQAIKISSKESIEIDEQLSMDGQETFLMAASNKKKSIAEEKYSEKDVLVEQISVERSSPTSFLPEVITFLLKFTYSFNMMLMAESF